MFDEIVFRGKGYVKFPTEIVQADVNVVTFLVLLDEEY